MRQSNKQTKHTSLGSESTVQFLLKKGALTSLKDRNGETASQLATAKGTFFIMNKKDQM